MKERPIIFSGPMVRAILEGRKTRTRRVFKQQPQSTVCSAIAWPSGKWQWRLRHPAGGTESAQAPEFNCPYGQPGDRLWVRETWKQKYIGLGPNRHKVIRYKADGFNEGEKLPWKPSIFMPRWASRLILEIVNIRVERVQEITQKDAKAEGVWPMPHRCPSGIDLCKGRQFDSGIHDCHRCAYHGLWQALNAKRGYGWEKNPWVWVLEFKTLEAP